MTRGGTLPEREREDAIGRADAQLEIQSWYCLIKWDFGCRSSTPPDAKRDLVEDQTVGRVFFPRKM
jgi:hypothetical protein